MKFSLAQWPFRNVVALGAVSFLTDVSREMIFPILPLFLTAVLGAGTAFVGLVEGIAESTASILNVLSGWLSDRIKRRKTLMYWGYGLSAVTRPLVAVATSGWHILVVRFVEKVGKGIRGAPRDALIAGSCPPESRGKGFGIHRFLDNLGSVLGPLLAFLLLVELGNDYRLFFWISSIPAFLAIGVLSLSVSETKRVEAPKQIVTAGDLLNLKPFGRDFKLFILCTAIFELANSSNAFLLLRARDIGLAVSLVPIIYLASNVFRSMSSLPGGILSDRFGRRNILFLGWVMYGVSYLGFAFVSSTAEIWIIFGIYGLFAGLTEGVKKAYVADLVPQEIRGTAYGLHSFISNIIKLPASLILGILWEKAGAAVAFSIGGTLAMIAGILLFALLPGVKQSRTQ